MTTGEVLIYSKEGTDARIDEVVRALTAAGFSDINETVQDILATALVAGGGISIAYDDTQGKVTISTAAAADITEQVQDIVASEIVAGAGITATYDDASGTLTLANTMNAEAIQDIVAGLLVAGTGVTLSYDDPNNKLTINSTGSGGGALTIRQSPTATSLVQADNGGILEVISSSTSSMPTVNTARIAYTTAGAAASCTVYSQGGAYPQNQLLVAIVSYNVAGTVTSPGWTKVFDQNDANGMGSVYTKIAGASEPDNYVFTIAGAASNPAWAIEILPISGYDSAAPIDSFANAVGSVWNNQIATPAMTAPHANDLHVVIGFQHGNGGGAVTMSDPKYTMDPISRATYNFNVFTAWSNTAPSTTAPQSPTFNLASNNGVSGSGLMIKAAGSGGAAVQVTIPLESTTPLSNNFVVVVTQIGTDPVKVVPAAGVTLHSHAKLFVPITTDGQYSSLTVRRRAANDWIVTGEATVTA